MTFRDPIPHKILTWHEVDRLVDVLRPKLRDAGAFDAMLVITRGGLIPGGLISEMLGLSYLLTAAVDFPLISDEARLAVWPRFFQFPRDALIADRRTLIVDDVWGSGRTATAVRLRCEAAHAKPFTCVLHFNPYRSLFARAEPNFFAETTDRHIVYPWEINRGTDNILVSAPDA